MTTPANPFLDYCQEKLSAPSSFPTLASLARADLIRSGDILQIWSKGFLGAAIRRAVQSWGNHNAIIVRPENDLAVGESTWPRGRIVDLAYYDRRISLGDSQVVVLRPAGATDAQGSLAAAWWLGNAQGRPYDLGAYPRLVLKSIVGDWFSWPAGWEWAWYCTESCRDAWRNGPSLDPWQKNNPTPRTTEKRTIAGAFDVVWASFVLKQNFSITTPQVERKVL